MTEKEKYIDIYSGQLRDKLMSRKRKREYRDGGYGRAFWGEGSIQFFKEVNAQSICDVGCGYGRFCDKVSDFIPCVYGCDIASVVTGNIINNPKITFIDAEAKNIPLQEGEVEWVSSFDCLEHCEQKDIDNIFEEFRRISTKGMVFSISHNKDKCFGIPLHLTVEPLEWWLDKIKKYGDVTLFGEVPIVKSKYIKCVY